MRHALALPILLALRAPAKEQFSAKVVGVSDGDTLTVLRGKESIKVRLHGVDALEAGQPFGSKAKQRASDLAFGQVVTIRPHDIDRYGHGAAEVVLTDGRSLNREMVRDGLAWWYTTYAPKDATLRDLQAGAKAAKRGLWAEADPVSPWDWRAGKGRGWPSRWIA